MSLFETILEMVQTYSCMKNAQFWLDVRLGPYIRVSKIQAAVWSKQILCEQQKIQTLDRTRTKNIYKF